jgi:hypothetical protein
MKHGVVEWSFSGKRGWLNAELSLAGQWSEVLVSRLLSLFISFLSQISHYLHAYAKTPTLSLSLSVCVCVCVCVSLCLCLSGRLYPISLNQLSRVLETHPTHSLTHSLTRSLTSSLTYSLTLSLSHSLTLTHPHSLTHSLITRSHFDPTRPNRWKDRSSSSSVTS